METSGRPVSLLEEPSMVKWLSSPQTALTRPWPVSRTFPDVTAVLAAATAGEVVGAWPWGIAVVVVTAETAGATAPLLRISEVGISFIGLRANGFPFQRSTRLC